ncbi:serine hydrolase domain-containing protein [Paenibacillus apiarius]|uniref:Beta-lactamase family protein n=1 Tax=Paenibacillus apiarius TaxID=46240 RepID=A0ABT4DUQ2_9BACL|nr:serine hydrolase [Paenibacillus apiarius]MCY9514384.1 beta-lactamase family protein [Paenibacillus apiarius]MCY9521078.1 beta-lactamase family protein [Paenibacillus apiarius]MCY9551925.1 beta-lactamase family protein [Paenibacillus apiarius]MCY9557812.1 beta-lactamase family protein [Paenibacillus apiarius]MCY9684499.1 beta-lactamase family protein [Paenibacillus apiarius]
MNLNNEHNQQYDIAKLGTLLHEDHIAWNFRNMDKILPKNDIQAPERKFLFQKVEQPLTEISYEINGQRNKVADYLQKVFATGFLVIKDDTIMTEQYFNGYSEQSTAMSMSVAKSLVSALMGIAFEEGAMNDVHDPVTLYLPELIGSGFDGASIKDILQMSSGVRFNEDYADENAEIYTFLNDVFGETAMPISKFVQKLTRLQAPGRFQYKSVDTQILCMLIEKITGKKASAYLEEKIWQPLGMEQDAYWNTDLHGNEIAFTFINATLRDYAKFGRLYLHNGNWNGRQIVSEKWVKQSVTPDRADLQPGAADDFFGYQYQWWIPQNSNGSEFMARGIYGQHIYVNQQEHAVIVKTGVDPTIFNIHDYEAVTAYRTILEHLK